LHRQPPVTAPAIVSCYLVRIGLLGDRVLQALDGERLAKPQPSVRRDGLVRGFVVRNHDHRNTQACSDFCRGDPIAAYDPKGSGLPAEMGDGTAYGVPS
jgi:hypothetical protein